MYRPRIALTVGDPRGIGPEISAHVLASPPSGVDLVVIGPDEMVAGLDAAVPIGALDENGPAKPCGLEPAPLSPKRAGELTGLAVLKAADMALRGEVAAIVTGPAEKRALHLAGYPFPGHTEWLAHLAGDVDVAMMLATGKLRVVLVTTHIPFREILTQLTEDRIVLIGEITRRALRERFGIEHPKLAVCALNPHAGESGLFGDEEERVLAPAARRLGAAGPFPADTVFVRGTRGEFDAILTPYHDVGMTAVKVAGFGRGVNITLGLPFVRTAPDHGTAFDIAGKGIADPSSMREAVEVAVRLATSGGPVAVSG